MAKKNCYTKLNPLLSAEIFRPHSKSAYKKISLSILWNQNYYILYLIFKPPFHTTEPPDTLMFRCIISSNLQNEKKEQWAILYRCGQKKEGYTMLNPFHLQRFSDFTPIVLIRRSIFQFFETGITASLTTHQTAKTHIWKRCNHLTLLQSLCSIQKK